MTDANKERLRQLNSSLGVYHKIATGSPPKTHRIIELEAVIEDAATYLNDLADAYQKRGYLVNAERLRAKATNIRKVLA